MHAVSAVTSPQLQGSIELSSRRYYNRITQGNAEISRGDMFEHWIGSIKRDAGAVRIS
jgi:hypothetical protein